MRRLVALFILTLGACAAAQAPSPTWQARFRVEVVDTCEVFQQAARQLTLHCTQGFRPLDPRQVPALQGQVPPGPLRLISSVPAPSGGLLHRYEAVPGGAAAPDPAWQV